MGPWELLGAALGGGVITKLFDYLTARGQWGQSDKAQLWQEIGELRGQVKSLRQELKRAVNDLHEAQLALALANDKAADFQAGYERIKAECAEMRRERDDRGRYGTLARSRRYYHSQIQLHDQFMSEVEMEIAQLEQQLGENPVKVIQPVR